MDNFDVKGSILNPDCCLDFDILSIFDRLLDVDNVNKEAAEDRRIYVKDFSRYSELSIAQINKLIRDGKLIAECEKGKNSIKLDDILEFIADNQKIGMRLIRNLTFKRLGDRIKEFDAFFSSKYSFEDCSEFFGLSMHEIKALVSAGKLAVVSYKKVNAKDDEKGEGIIEFSNIYKYIKEHSDSGSLIIKDQKLVKDDINESEAFFHCKYTVKECAEFFFNLTAAQINELICGGKLTAKCDKAEYSFIELGSIYNLMKADSRIAGRIMSNKAFGYLRVIIEEFDAFYDEVLDEAYNYFSGTNIRERKIETVNINLFSKLSSAMKRCDFLVNEARRYKGDFAEEHCRRQEDFKAFCLKALKINNSDDIEDAADGTVFSRLYGEYLEKQENDYFLRYSNCFEEIKEQLSEIVKTAGDILNGMDTASNSSLIIRLIEDAKNKAKKDSFAEREAAMLRIGNEFMLSIRSDIRNGINNGIEAEMKAAVGLEKLIAYEKEHNLGKLGHLAIEQLRLEFNKILNAVSAPESQYNLGICYLQGLRDLAKNEAEAVKWLKKAAEQGLAAALSLLGYCYINGNGGLPKDEEKAVNLYRKAAEQGFAHAQCNLGVYYMNGYGCLPKDEEKAVGLFKEAAEQGHAVAQYNLGVCYVHGYGGLPKDEEKAVNLYRKAAEQGLAEAQCELGLYYVHGYGGLPEDEEKAADLFRTAAEQGFAHAQSNLGVYYMIGNGGLPKDEEKAADLFKKAAEQGFAHAQYNLGLCYVHGYGGLPKDEEKAADLFRMAAEQGFAEAQYTLARCYFNGVGVDADKDEAERWRQMAAANGVDKPLS